MVEIREEAYLSQLKKYLSSCVNTTCKVYYDNEPILKFTERKGQIGFISYGHATILKTDREGHTIILKELKTNDIFSSLFFQNSEDDIYIISSTITEVIFIDYFSIIKNCRRGCLYHQNLILYLFELLINDNKQQNEKIELLSKRTVREKIKFFLKKRVNKKGIFKVTTSYKAIASYIAVDRSNFMREIKKMENEGLIEKCGKTIKVLF